MAVQRDYGRRDDRKQARLKYLVSEWGIDKFRAVTEQYMGKKFAPFQPLPPWEFHDYLGWHEQGDGKLFVGCFVQNGRLRGAMKAALRSVIEEYELSVRLTPNQNLLLCDVEPQWRDAIESALRSGGIVPPEELDSLQVRLFLRAPCAGVTAIACGGLHCVMLRGLAHDHGRSASLTWPCMQRSAMACPALPLCGLAIGEAERGLPDVARRVRALLDKLSLEGENIVMRMTGCANGCAPPCSLFFPLSCACPAAPTGAPLPFFPLVFFQIFRFALFRVPVVCLPGHA